MAPRATDLGDLRRDPKGLREIQGHHPPDVLVQIEEGMNGQGGEQRKDVKDTAANVQLFR